MNLRPQKLADNDELRRTVNDQAREIHALRESLREMNVIIFKHHEIGHVVRAYKKAFTENCDVCEKCENQLDNASKLLGDGE